MPRWMEMDYSTYLISLSCKGQPFGAPLDKWLVKTKLLYLAVLLF